jgi:hypothetical protein
MYCRPGAVAKEVKKLGRRSRQAGRDASGMAKPDIADVLACVAVARFVV